MRAEQLFTTEWSDCLYLIIEVHKWQTDKHIKENCHLTLDVLSEKCPMLSCLLLLEVVTVYLNLPENLRLMDPSNAV